MGIFILTESSTILVLMSIEASMYSITKNGKCAKHLCVIDEDHMTVSASECGIEFNFRNLDNWAFRSGDRCVFYTGDACTFTTGSNCKFFTESCCMFFTNSLCTFVTKFDCMFNTGYSCTFKVGRNCVLLRYDVRGITELPDNITILTNDRAIEGYKVNTREWVKKHMDNENGILFILKNEEFMEIPQITS